MKAVLLLFLSLASRGLGSQPAEPTNSHFWHTLETTAAPENIWNLWTDVNQWKTWDSGLQDASLEEPFELGAKGTIVSLEGRKSKFKIVAIEPGVSYTFRTGLPLGGLYVKRFLVTEAGKTTFTHEVWFKGITKGIFAKAFGAEFREMLPGVLQNIKTLAEGNQ